MDYSSESTIVRGYSPHGNNTTKKRIQPTSKRVHTRTFPLQRQLPSSSPHEARSTPRYRPLLTVPRYKELRPDFLLCQSPLVRLVSERPQCNLKFVHQKVALNINSGIAISHKPQANSPHVSRQAHRNIDLKAHKLHEELKLRAHTPLAIVPQCSLRVLREESPRAAGMLKALP